MKSLRDLFRYGPGPSSSHTIAPFHAAKRFSSLVPKGEKVEVTFYGSLAYTFRGHHSDQAVLKGLAGHEVETVCDTKTPMPHPLTMRFRAGDVVHVYYSLGGGALFSPTDPYVNEKEVFPFSDLEGLKAEYASSGMRLAEFIASYEREGIDEYLDEILHHMFDSIEQGLKKEGPLPANDNPRLQISRSAGKIFALARKMRRGQGKRELLLSAYAYAVAESSACGDNVVTAPTCGSSGVVPAVLYYLYRDKRVKWDKLKQSLYVAGIFGDIVKTNASIAGSVGGCQAEIGTACSMGAAALAYANGLSFYQIEYGAEVAMEHFLGLSCDPVDGYVIIPCIERNGVGAMRAYDSYLYAKNIAPIRMNHVSFDDVVRAMKITGDSLDEKYKETALGGLASILKADDKKD